MRNDWHWMTNGINEKANLILEQGLIAWDGLDAILTRFSEHLTLVLPASPEDPVNRGALGRKCLCSALEAVTPLQDWSESAKGRFIEFLFSEIGVLGHLIVWNAESMPIDDGEAAWLDMPQGLTPVDELELSIWPPGVSLSSWRCSNPGAIGVAWSETPSVQPQLMRMLVMGAVLSRDDYRLASMCQIPDRGLG